MHPSSPRPWRLLIVGALHVDDIATSGAPLVARASNPVSWQRAVGGVAANAAMAARLCVAPEVGIELCAATGTDPFADQLERVIAQAGVTPCLQRLSGHQTGRYTAIIDDDGELYIGLSDVALAERLNPADVPVENGTAACRAMLVDANLSQHCLRTLTARARSLGMRVAAMSVAPLKSRRLQPLAQDIDLLFVNRREAMALLDDTLPLGVPIARLADGLDRLGFRDLVLTDGSGPVLVQSADQRELIPVPCVAACRSVNGAGDALAGAGFAAWSSGTSLFAAVRDAGLHQAGRVIRGENRPRLLSSVV